MLETETELWGHVQPKKLKLTWLDELQRTAQTAQVRAPNPAQRLLKEELS